MLNNLTRRGVELVHGHAVHVKGVASIAHNLGNNHGVPRYSDGLSGPVIDHAMGDHGLLPVVEDTGDALRETEGLLVAVQAGQLHPGGIDDANVVVVDEKFGRSVQNVRVVLAEGVHCSAEIDLKLSSFVDNVLENRW